MNAGFEVKELDWDTKYFGTKCARVSIAEELNENQFLHLKRIINQYGFVTIDNNSRNMRNNEQLCSLIGAYLVDVPLIFSYFLSENDEKYVEEYTVINNKEQSKKIESIGKSSFLQGRFYNDPRIDKSVASGLYAHWIKNSFFRQDKYFVLTEKDNGFILLSKINKGEGLDIELIAVDDKERKKGIAVRMLESLKYYAVNNGHSYINVVTQANNLPAINLYTKNGFSLIGCNYIYHFWNIKTV